MMSVRLMAKSKQGEKSALDKDAGRRGQAASRPRQESASRKAMAQYWLWCVGVIYSLPHRPHMDE
jgi:hypothetical protein